MAEVDVFGPIQEDYYLCRLAGKVGGKSNIRTEQKEAGFCELPGRPVQTSFDSTGSDSWFFLKDASLTNKVKTKHVFEFTFFL